MKGRPGEVVGQYQIPGEFEVFPDEEGDVTIVADRAGQRGGGGGPERGAMSHGVAAEPES